MCAECHSTDLKKNYNLDADTYKTTWSEISVGCEAYSRCHSAPRTDRSTRDWICSGGIGVERELRTTPTRNAKK